MKLPSFVTGCLRHGLIDYPPMTFQDYRIVPARANTRPIPRRGLSREESAQYVGISPSKFDELRKDGRIGPPRLIDGRKVWDIFELDQSFDAFPVEGGVSDEDWQSAV